MDRLRQPEAANVRIRPGQLHQRRLGPIEVASPVEHRSRSDLLTTLYRHLGVTEDLVSSLARVWESADAVSALTEWASHIARSHPRTLAINRAIERARFTDPDAAALWDLTMRNWLKSCRRLAAWLDDEGSLSERWTVQSAADMLWTLMSWDVTELGRVAQVERAPLRGDVRRSAPLDLHPGGMRGTKRAQRHTGVCSRGGSGDSGGRVADCGWPCRVGTPGAERAAVRGR